MLTVWFAVSVHDHLNVMGVQTSCPFSTSSSTSSSPILSASGMMITAAEREVLIQEMEMRIAKKLYSPPAPSSVVVMR